MKAAPFAPGDRVLVTCGGLWAHLHGYTLEVAACLRSRTFAGGWAVRLTGDRDLCVPDALVSVKAVRHAPPPPFGRDGLALLHLARAAVTGRQRIRRRDLAGALGFLALLTLVRRDARAEPEGRLERRRREFRVTGVIERLERAGFRPLAEGVAARHGLALSEVVGPRRHKAIAATRDELCHALRSHPRGLSLPDIGRLLDLDHTTIRDAVRRHQARLDALATQTRAA